VFAVGEFFHDHSRRANDTSSTARWCGHCQALEPTIQYVINRCLHAFASLLTSFLGQELGGAQEQGISRGAHRVRCTQFLLVFVSVLMVMWGRLGRNCSVQRFGREGNCGLFLREEVAIIHDSTHWCRASHISSWPSTVNRWK
jgi:hypothetical protein